MQTWVSWIRMEPRSVTRALMQTAKEEGLNSPGALARTKRLKKFDVILKCEYCDFRASSRQQIALHAFKVHGCHRRARSLIDNVYCPICMQHLHSRRKVICHIEEKSERCKASCAPIFIR